MNGIWMKWALIAVGVLGQFAASGARAAGVALVADVAGQVAIVESPATKQAPAVVRLMQAVNAGATMTVAANARATLFFPSTGTAVEMRGPGSFAVDAQDVRAIGSASPPTSRQLNAALRAVRIDRGHLAQAAIVMRGSDKGEQPDLLAPGTIVSAREGLTFRWSSLGPGREYRFRLMALTGEVIHEARTPALELTLPPGADMAEGERYLWSVLDTSATARRGPTQWREVVIATPRQRADIARLNLGEESSDSAERNLRELLMSQMLTSGGTGGDRAR